MPNALYQRPTVDNAVYKAFGMQPNMDRLNLLPRKDPRQGWIAPNLLYQMARAVVAPGVAAHGGDVSPEDAINFGGNLVGAGIGASAAVPTNGSIVGMGVARKPITETAAFKKWFEGSKVVDDAGKPRMVYHGTNQDFQRFDSKKATQGLHWFGSDKNAITSGEITSQYGSGGTKKLMSIYAAMKNPAGWDEYSRFTLGELKARGYDGAILPDPDGSFTGFVFDPNLLKIINKE
jgi:hypothetical protein